MNILNKLSINNDMNLYIGIDYSLNSTGISIIDGDLLNVISVFKTDNDINKMLSRNDQFKLLSESLETNLILIKKEKNNSAIYHVSERLKIKSFAYLTDIIVSQISKYSNNPDVYIAMEGISFGSSGNSLIDISMSTGILRSKILDILDGDSNRFFVFPPTTIKKFAGSGSFKKVDMLNSIISNNSESYNFIKILENNINLIKTKSGVVKKPIEDIVDSVWVAKFLKYTIENEKL